MAIGFFEWPQRQPIAVKIILVPILAVIFSAYGILAIAFLIVFVIPCVTVVGMVRSRRFWRELKRRGQVARWLDVEPKLSAGAGVLLVTIGPKGDAAGYSWLINSPREEIDPARVIPSWQELQNKDEDVLWSAYDAINRWTVERLGAYESTACAVWLSKTEVAKLDGLATRSTILVIPCWCEGSLEERICEDIGIRL